MSRIATRMTAAALGAGALLAAAALPAAAHDGRQQQPSHQVSWHQPSWQHQPVRSQPLRYEPSRNRPSRHEPSRNRERTSVVLGAVQSDSPGRDDRSARSLNAEWITVSNTGRSAVNLSGWTLSSSEHHAYRFGHLVLGAHKSVRVHSGYGRNTSRDVYQGSRTYVWGNYSDTATLRDSRGHLVDTESWGYRGGRR
ncbi:Lamin Tail Domain [Actinacidiphila yanglinensis]|uniref:Lamin Tail Domain n=1 Tax=Actinacidiphila yanglinensis TaxID=310779 RepID=A0A1H5S759_9ACTN|nr:lamin tail domain-containing protein [Actinacidiphila yanglinensis]SEF46429.1 Lamin Tail Domain [Actinacidiphila yanglinensis]